MKCCNLFHKENCGLWLVDTIKTIYSALSPNSSSPPPHKGPWMARKALTNSAEWCWRGTERVCVYLACSSASLAGRDPRYAGEVCSGQGRDRMWPSGETSTSPIGQVSINQHPLSRLQQTTSNTQEDLIHDKLLFIYLLYKWPNYFGSCHALSRGSDRVWVR